MKKIVLFILTLLSIQTIYAQSVGIGTASPHTSAKLDINSSNSGLLIPRMSSAERKAIQDPAKGLLVFDSSKASFMFYNGVEWSALGSGNENAEAITPSSNDNTYKFGYEVAIKGNYAAIASDKLNNGSGVVYIYEKNGNGDWIQKTVLTPPNPLPTDDFGHSLDIDGDYLVVGDPNRRDANNSRKGMVYLYHRVNGNWILETALQRSETNEDFGWDVAVCTNTPQGLVIVVGMPASGGIYGIANAGQVVVYRIFSGNWVAQTLSTFDFSQNSKAGYSVDIEGDLIAIGTPFRNNDMGGVALYKYQTSLNGWNSEYSQFVFEVNSAAGYSVAITNDYVAVGAPSVNNSTQGKVHIFYKRNLSWQSQTINTPVSLVDGGNPHFGAHVAINGDNLIVSAPSFVFRGFEIGGNQPGRAVYYKLTRLQNEITWSLKRVWQSDYYLKDDQFSVKAGVFGSDFIIGHPLFSTPSVNNKGRVLTGSLN